MQLVLPKRVHYRITLTINYDKLQQALNVLLDETLKYRECKVPEGLNLKPLPAGKSLYYPDSYRFSCLSGYNTSDQTDTFCQKNGSLTLFSFPICSRK